MTDIEVRPSPIHGLGMFATRDFAAGERILRRNHVRELTAEAPVRPGLGEDPAHTDDIEGGRVVLLGFPDRYFNHCCDPSAYVRVIDGVHYIYARRAIRAGEEITNDYAINNAWEGSEPCACRSPRCRGRITGYFHLPLERQLEYLPLLAEWFVEEHRERIEAVRRAADGIVDGMRCGVV
jgi:SET domain-containing protein